MRLVQGGPPLDPESQICAGSLLPSDKTHLVPAMESNQGGQSRERWSQELEAAFASHMHAACCFAAEARERHVADRCCWQSGLNKLKETECCVEQSGTKIVISLNSRNYLASATYTFLCVCGLLLRSTFSSVSSGSL